MAREYLGCAAGAAVVVSLVMAGAVGCGNSLPGSSGAGAAAGGVAGQSTGGVAGQSTGGVAGSSSDKNGSAGAQGGAGQAGASGVAGTSGGADASGGCKGGPNDCYSHCGGLCNPDPLPAQCVSGNWQCPPNTLDSSANCGRWGPIWQCGDAGVPSTGGSGGEAGAGGQGGAGGIDACCALPLGGASGHG